MNGYEIVCEAVKAKYTKEQCNYVDPSETEGEHCQSCEYFKESDNTCSLVEGTIKASAWCKYWEQ